MRIFYSGRYVAAATIFCGTLAFSQLPPPVHLPDFDKIQQQWNSQNDLNSKIQTSNQIDQINQSSIPAVEISAATFHAAIPAQELSAVAIPSMEASLRAAPAMVDRAVYLRGEITRLTLRIRELGFNIIGNGVADLALKQRDDLETVLNWDEARALLGQLVRYQKELQELAPDNAEGRKREQVYLHNLPVGPAPSYAVHVSDNTPQGGPPTCEDHFYITYEKVLKSAGFDGQGKPVHKWDYDTVSHRYQVCK